MKGPEIEMHTRRELAIDGGPNSHGWRPWRLVERDVTEPASPLVGFLFHMVYTSEIRTLDTYYGTRLPLLKRLLWNFTIWRYKRWTGK